jgi:hypothetical protein
MFIVHPSLSGGAMRSTSRTALPFVLALGALSTFVCPAAADTWQVPRHDAARTGASSGVAPIQKPIVTWRAYMGGRPVDTTVRFGLGAPSVVVAAVGGRFVAKHAITQATLWKSEILGVGDVAGVADLDGDGAPEVVVRTENRVHVLSAVTGATRWSSPPDMFRTPGAVRVLDMNGDGIADLYIDECTGCAKAGTMSAGAFAFPAGFDAPQALWTRPTSAKPAPSNSGSDALADLDGDGVPEVVLTSADEVLLVRGKDGAPITSLTLPGAASHPFPQADALAADIDGQPGKELVIIQQSGQVATKSGPPGVHAFRIDPKTGTKALLFSYPAPSYDDEVVASADSLSDLDGDGVAEVIFSKHTAAGVWSTVVLRGADGAVLQDIPDTRFEGAADLDGKPGAELVLAHPTGLFIYHYGANLEPLSGGPLAGVRAFQIADPALRNNGRLIRRLAVLQHPGFPSRLLVGHPSAALPYQELPPTWAFTDMSFVTLTANGEQLNGKYSPLLGEITDIVQADFATRPYPQVAVGTSAGTIDVLDQKLHATNGIVFWNGKATGTILGGGKQPATGVAPGVLAGADANGPFVVLPGSPLGLYVGDARFASLIIPPLPRWLGKDMDSASIIDLGGSQGMAVVGVEGHNLVARRSTDGTSLGASDLGQGRARSSPIPLKVAGKATPIVGIDWEKPGVQIAQSGVDFAAGSLVWQGEALPFGGFFGSGAGDLDGDGTDEWYSMNGPLNRRDAKTGAVSAVLPSATGYAIPVIASFAGGPAPELLLSAGAAPLQLLGVGFAKIWEAAAAEPVNGMAGARVVCPDGARFVTPSVLSSSVRVYGGATGTLAGERVLAGGQIFNSVDEALAQGLRPGVLSNASGVAKLGGGGPAALVGSTDGYLYALDACSLELRWSKFLGASVAEPVVADVDGDGADEIMVGTADGFVQNIDVPSCTPPTWVSLAGQGADATLSLKPGDKATVDFEKVPEATSYELALVDPDDKPLWDPAYRAAQPGDTVDLTGALAGRPYRIAVRARSAAGESPEMFSGPIVVNDGTPPSLDAVAGTPGKDVQVGITASDDLALDHYQVRVREIGAPDASAFIGDDGLLSGAKAQATSAFTPPSDLWGKGLELTVEVVDSAGNVSRRLLGASVDSSGNVKVVDDPELIPVPGNGGTSGPGGSSVSVGFGCAVANGASGSGLAVAVAGLLLGLVRRVRRRAH